MKLSHFILLLVSVATLHFFLAMRIAPADDELYYWCWSKELQPSYFDHPPVTAYLIRASTFVFGDTLFAIRFPACLCALGSIVLIGHLTGRRGIGWLLATPMIALGSILMTPDAPVLFFWTAYAVWLIKIQQAGTRPHWSMWLLGGVLLGLGGLSKYTMALAVPGALLSFLLNRDPLKAPWRLGFISHLLICLAVLSPVFIYNAMNDFSPLRFQFNHAAGKSSAFSPLKLAEFVGTQVLLFGALPFVLLPWCLANRRELGADNRLRVSMWMFLFPTIFFLLKGATGRVEGNWPFISYMTVLPLALRQWDGLREASWARRWLMPASFGIPAIATIVIVAQSIVHVPLPGRADRLAVMNSRLDATRQVVEWAKAEGISHIYGPNYQITSQLKFQQIDAAQMPGLSRESHFTMGKSKVVDPSIYVYLYLDKPGLFPQMNHQLGYGYPQRLLTIPETIGDKSVGEYALFRYDRLD